MCQSKNLKKKSLKCHDTSTCGARICDGGCLGSCTHLLTLVLSPHAACTISKHGKGLFCIVSRTIVVTHIVDIFCVSIDLLHPFQGFVVQLHHVRLKAFPVAGLLDCFQFFVPTSGMGPYLETCLDYNPGPKWSSKAVAQSVKLRKNTCWLLWHTLFLDSLDQQLNLECFWKGLAIKHTAYCL